MGLTAPLLLLLLLLAATSARSGGSPCPWYCKPRHDPHPDCCNGSLKCAPSVLENLTMSNSGLSVNTAFDKLFSEVLFCKLRFIEAKGNALKDLSFLAFTPNVTQLTVSGNALRYIRVGSFEHSKALEYLDLSDNELFDLEGVLEPLKNLSHLDLSGNQLSRVKASWFASLSKLTELDLSSNGIVSIPADTLQPLVSLAVFSIADNPLINEDLSLLLSTGRRLEEVDASETGLSRIPSTLTRSVRILKLAGNRLTSVNGGDLDSYPLLRLLDLSRNRLTVIEEDALGRLENLERLDLGENILPEVPNSLPSGLRRLDLRRNVISSVRTNDLQGLANLTSLDLGGNVIREFVGGFLAHVPLLEKLDVSDNPVRSLPPDTLSGPAGLTHLNMSGLASLEVRKNQNHDTAFPILALERLVFLDVSGSPALAAQLLDDAAALGACKSLEELDLSYANVSGIGHDVALKLPRLRMLNLKGNAWNCSEEQRWLQQWMKSHQVSTNRSAVCKWPPELVGKFLIEMPEIPTDATSASTVQTRRKLTTDKTMTSNKSSSIVAKNVEILSTKSSPREESSTKPTDRVDGVTNEPTHPTDDSLTTSDSKVITSAISAMVDANTQTSQKLERTIENTDIESKRKSTTQKNKITTTEFEGHTLPAIKTQSTTPTTIHSTAPKLRDAIIDENNITGEAKSDLSTDGEHVVPTTTEAPMKTNNISTETSLPTETETVSDSSTVISTTNSHENPVDKSKISSIDTKKSSSIRDAKSIMDDDKAMLNDSPFQGKRLSSQLFHESKRSKILPKNQEARFSSEPESVAEKLNGQSEESETHASENTTISAHPGMLVLLGATVGAVAVLSVILSRRATVNTRDQQYQRHENIEVHTLTPTTELW